MLKFSKIVLLGLLSCLSIRVYSFVGQKLVEAVKQSNLLALESEIKANKVTPEEAKGLLEIAQQIEAIKRSRVDKPTRRQKKVIKLLKKVRLLVIAGIAFGTGIFSGLATAAFFDETSVNKDMTLIFAPMLGLVSFISGAYGIYLFKKTRKFKPKQEQYYDSMAVRQILTRLAADPE